MLDELFMERVWLFYEKVDDLSVFDGFGIGNYGMRKKG